MKYQIECKYCGEKEVRNMYTIHAIYKCYKCGHKELIVKSIEDFDVFGYYPKKKIGGSDESSMS